MNAGRVLLGAVLVVFGSVVLLDTADLIDAGDSIRAGWPAIFIVLGVAQIGLERRLTIVSGLLLIAGGAALTVTTGVIDADLWALTWPILVIGAGVWLVAWRRVPVVSHDDEVTRLAVFAPGRVASRAGALRRADMTSVFSSLRLDLTRARLAPEGARVAATAVFGEVVVVVPKGWQVEVRGLPIFGGWDDTTSRLDVEAGAPRLQVQVLSLFGGVQVRHSRVWR